MSKRESPGIREDRKVLLCSGVFVSEMKGENRMLQEMYTPYGFRDRLFAEAAQHRVLLERIQRVFRRYGISGRGDAYSGVSEGI